MINSDELIFVVDENNNPLSPEIRRIVHKKNLWHRTTGIWVINKKKQILAQKRSMQKDQNPGFWEAYFGGHIAPNQTSIDNAKIELGEELGINAEKKDFIFYKACKSDKPTHKEFNHIFAFILDREDLDFTLEESEIDKIIWKDLEEVKDILLVKKDPHWVQKPWDPEVLNWLQTL